METLRLTLLLAQSGRINLGKLARDLGWSRASVYARLVWRKTSMTLDHIGDVLGLLKIDGNVLYSPVIELTTNQLDDAFRVFQLDGMKIDVFNEAVGETDARRLLFQSNTIENKDGQLHLVRR